MNNFIFFSIIVTKMNFLKPFIPSYIVTPCTRTVSKINLSHWMFPPYFFPKIFLLFTEMLVFIFFIPSTVFFIILFSHS